MCVFVVVVVTIIINRQVLVLAQSGVSYLIDVCPQPSATFAFVFTVFFSPLLFLFPSLSCVGANALCLWRIVEASADTPVSQFKLHVGIW